MAPNTIYVLYILGALGVLLIVYAFPVFDMRGVGRVRRRRLGPVDDEGEFAAPAPGDMAAVRRAEAISILPRADLTAVVTVLACAAVAVMATLGFLGPRLIDQMLGEGPVAPLADWAWRAGAPLERVAQVAGALCFGLIAMRMLRPMLAFAALFLIAAGVNLAVNYVLGRPLLTLFGA